MLNARGAVAPAQSSLRTLLFTNYECCKTEHNDRDETRANFRRFKHRILDATGTARALVGTDPALGILRIDPRSLLGTRWSPVRFPFKHRGSN